MSTPKIGDVVRYVCGGPGPDVTEALVESVADGKISGWELNLWRPITDLSVDKVWVISGAELESRTRFSTEKRKGSFSVRELMRERINERKGEA